MGFSRVNDICSYLLELPQEAKKKVYVQEDAKGQE